MNGFEGNMLRTVVVFQDTTGKRSKEESLRRDDERLRLILKSSESMPGVGIFLRP